MQQHWGQIVVGPPGSGKSTYCHALQQYLSPSSEPTEASSSSASSSSSSQPASKHPHARDSMETTLLQRPVHVINLDPANEGIPYECSIDVMELVSLSRVMDEMKLGPNGGLVYCMEFLEKNIDWLIERIAQLPVDAYLLFDCPGQVELFTHHSSLRSILMTLTGTADGPEGKRIEQLLLGVPVEPRTERKMDLRLSVVHLADSHYCTDPALFISVLLTSLSTMLQLEMPHVNVLTKIDLLRHYGSLPFKLEFFTDVIDLAFLVDRLNSRDNVPAKFKALNAAICEVVQDFSLVSFLPLNAHDPISLSAVVKLVDKSNGFFSLGASEVLGIARSVEHGYDHASYIQDLFLDEL